MFNGILMISIIGTGTGIYKFFSTGPVPVPVEHKSIQAGAR